MDFLLYTSRCVSRQFEIQDLDIMRCALSNNPKFAITGFLHRNKVNYFQYVEGPSAHIEQLFSNLKADTRHIDFRIRLSGSVGKRVFEEWSMGYSSFDGTQHPAITVESTADEMLNFLSESARRQMESLAKLKQTVDSSK